MAFHQITHHASDLALFVLVLGLLVACSAASTGPVPVNRFETSLVDVSVIDYGAVPDDELDDTVAFNTAIQALPAEGGKVRVPGGIYLLSAQRRGNISQAIYLSQMSNIEVQGDGIGRTILRMAPGATYQGDTHIISIDGSNGITVHDLTLDGNLGNVTYSDEQSHGIELRGSARIRMERVKFMHMHGDGIRLLGSLRDSLAWAEDIHIQECEFFENGRSGIAIQRGVRGVRIANNTFQRISDQAIDMEPTGGTGASEIAPRYIDIIENSFVHTSSLALTVSGISSSDPARNIQVSGNSFEAAGIFVINAVDVHITDNLIRSGEDWQPIEIRKGSERIWIARNELDARKTNGPAIVLSFHTSRAPKDVHVIDNGISVGTSDGVYARDSEELTISGNEMDGNGESAIRIDDIVSNSPLSGFLIQSNTTRGFANGVRLLSRGDAITAVCIRANDFIGSEIPVRLSGPISQWC